MSGKWKISVDTSVVANGDSIASYLADAAGNFINSQSISGSRWLQSVSPSDKAEDSAHVSGDYGSFVLGVRNDAGTLMAADGDYIPLSIDANGALRVAASVNFAGDYAEDSAHVSGDIGLFGLGVRRDVRSSMVDTDGDYSGYQFTSNGDMRVRDDDANTTLSSIDTSLNNIEADADEMNTSLNNIEADADEMNTSLNNIEGYINDLRKAEDSIHASGDYGIQSLAVRKDAQGSNAGSDGDYSSLLTWSEGSLKTVDIFNSSVLQQQVSVADTATLLPAASLANRRRILVQNVDNTSCWIGSASVTDTGATGGIEVPKGGHIELEAGPACSIYAIAAAGDTVNVRVLECA